VLFSKHEITELARSCTEFFYLYSRRRNKFVKFTQAKFVLLAVIKV